MATVISRAVALLQGKNYSGSGNWLDEINSHDAVNTNATFDTDHWIMRDASVNARLVMPGHADFDFGATQDWTFMFILETTAQAASASWVFFNAVNGSSPGQLAQLNDATIVSVRSWAQDQGVAHSVQEYSSAIPADGVKFAFALRMDRTAEEFQAFIDGTPSDTATDTTSLGDQATTADFIIGSNSGLNNAFYGYIYAVAIWREALSDADIATAGDELMSAAGTVLVWANLVHAGEG